MVRPRNRIVHQGERLGRFQAFELSGERGRYCADETIAAVSVLLAGEPEPAQAREPSGLRVKRLGHALPGACNAEGEVEGGVRPLGDDTLDLLGQREDHDALAGAQDAKRERVRRRRETRADAAPIVAQIAYVRSHASLRVASRFLTAGSGRARGNMSSAALHMRAHVCRSLDRRPPTNHQPGNPVNREVRPQRERGGRAMSHVGSRRVTSTMSSCEIARRSWS